MKLGYIRVSFRHSEKAQRKALEAAGVLERHTYMDQKASDDALKDVVRLLRIGDELCVATAGRLVANRKNLKPVLDMIHEKQSVALDLSTGETSKGYAFPIAAIEELARDRYALTPAEASRIGKLGGGEPKVPPMSKEDALKIWKDHRISSRDALKQINITNARAYRWLGPRNLPAGRPIKDKSGEFIPPDMKVYFVRANGHGPVKIGTTVDIKGRLSALSHPLIRDLKLLATVDGGYGEEKEMHKRFAEYRIKGEWFKFEGKLQKFVEGLQEEAKRNRKR